MTKNKTVIKFGSFSIVIIGLVFLILLIQFRWRGNNNENVDSVIGSDGAGYYEYLPYFFIDDFTNNRVINPAFHVKQNGKYVNKYYAGTAIAQSAFFFSAYAWCKISGNKCDGYSTPFQLAVSIGGLVYFMLTLILLQKLLIQHFHFSTGITNFTVTAFSFGSMLLYYVIICGSFSHVYSVFFSVLFFWQISKIARKQISPGGLILLMLALSMIIVIRPVNILLVLFIPFFFTSFGELKDAVKGIIRLKWWSLVLAITIAALPVLLQLFAWYEQCGSFFIWSYKNEGFYFTHPEILNFLFSYRKGLFVYSPILLISLIGLFYLWKLDKWRFYWAVFSLVIVVNVLSSWWCWHYAGGFGMRPMVDYSIIFLLLLAFLINSIKSKVIKTAAISLVCVTIFLNLVFSYQFYKGIINPFSMDQTRFWNTFLKTNDTYINCLGGMMDTKPYAPNGFKKVFGVTEKFNTLPDGVLDCSGNEFPFEPVKFSAIKRESIKGNFYIEIKLKRKSITYEGGKSLIWVIASDPADSLAKPVYQTFKIKEFAFEEKNKWINSTYIVSFFNHEFDSIPLHVFIHNPAKEAMIIDDVNVKVFAAN